MARTAEMFDKPHVPRIRRMHVMDAGTIEGERAARFYCERCETETAWVICNLTEQRRGVPCPVCNQGSGPNSGRKCEMKERELSPEAIAKGNEMAKGIMNKYSADEYLREIRLTEDRLAAMLARAYDAGKAARS